jgi:SAM-dependent methyltransferase
MMWFDKHHKSTVFCDIRSEEIELCDGRIYSVAPDIIADFRDIPFPDRTFSLVVFDPPHLTNVGETSYMRHKYGFLDKGWKKLISKGFEECFRVLKLDGVLIFKWSDSQIPVGQVVKLSPYSPLFGTRKGKNSIWICFMKDEGVTK